MSSHVPLDQLFRLAAGTMNEEHRTEVERHVAACETCREQLAELNRLSAVIKDVDGRSAPESWVARAERLAAGDGRRDPVPESWVDELLADLEFDSSTSAVAGVRGEPGGGRHLVFKGGRVTIDVTCSSVGERIRIDGQVLVDEPTSDASVPTIVQIDDRGALLPPLVVNEFGEFTCSVSGVSELSFLVAGPHGLVRTPPIGLDM